MPLIERSGYKAPLHLRNGHLSTILPSMFKKAANPGYERERLELPDGDFLDIDWLKNAKSDKVVIISHGLEGSSMRYYVINAAKYFHRRGWNVMAWNYRSCSETMNRNLRLYHHGVTDDLGAIVDHATHLNFNAIYLIGYSMGGSTTLKYLGEQGSSVNDRVRSAAVFSVPCNLWNSAQMLLVKSNRIYKERFLNKLKKKIIAKAKQFPDQVDIAGIERLSTFEELDNRYTAPLHGFQSAKHFYETSTCDLVMSRIKVRSLIVNAQNDPLLGEKCYPRELAASHRYVHLEIPETGGHVGFPVFGSPHSWSEMRALEFFSNAS